MHLENQYYCGDDKTAERARLILGSDLDNGTFEAVSEGVRIGGEVLVIEVPADELRNAKDPNEIVDRAVEPTEDPSVHRINRPAFVAIHIAKALRLHKVDGNEVKETGGKVKPIRLFTDHSLYN